MNKEQEYLEERTYLDKACASKEEMEKVKVEMEEIRKLKNEFLFHKHDLEYLEPLVKEQIGKSYQEESSKQVIEEIILEYTRLREAKCKQEKTKRMRFGILGGVVAFLVIGLFVGMNTISTKDQEVDEWHSVVEVVAEDKNARALDLEKAVETMIEYEEAYVRSINSSDISHALPFVEQGSEAYEMLELYVELSTNESLNQIIYDIAVMSARKEPSDLSVEVKTKEYIGYVFDWETEQINEQEIFYKLIYKDGNYYVTHRETLDERVLEVRSLIDEDSSFSVSAIEQNSQLEGVIDGKYHIVFDLSCMTMDEYGTKAFKAYYTNYPDTLYDIKIIRDYKSGITLAEYLGESCTGIYTLERIGNQLVGTFLNETTGEEMDVVINL